MCEKSQSHRHTAATREQNRDQAGGECQLSQWETQSSTWERTTRAGDPAGDPVWLEKPLLTQLNCIIHILILRTPSLSLHSSTKQDPFLCQWSFSSHFKCTSTICDSSNLEIRLKGVFFISEQSFKELKECAQSATDSVPGREDARSMSAALRFLLILFCAERSCQRRSEHSNSETAGEGR